MVMALAAVHFVFKKAGVVSGLFSFSSSIPTSGFPMWQGRAPVSARRDPAGGHLPLRRGRRRRRATWPLLASFGTFWPFLAPYLEKGKNGQKGPRPTSKKAPSVQAPTSREAPRSNSEVRSPKGGRHLTPTPLPERGGEGKAQGGLWAGNSATCRGVEKRRRVAAVHRGR